MRQGVGRGWARSAGALGGEKRPDDRSVGRRRDGCATPCSYRAAEGVCVGGVCVPRVCGHVLTCYGFPCYVENGLQVTGTARGFQVTAAAITSAAGRGALGAGRREVWMGGSALLASLASNDKLRAIELVRLLSLQCVR
eukprot:366553-Chlamydomonas_euryale.AAC.2